MRFTAVFAILTATAAPAAAQAVDDQKSWTSVAAEADLTRLVRVGASEELRVGVDSGFDQARTGVEVGVRPLDYLSFGVLYLLIVSDGDPRLGSTDETRHRVAGEVTARYGPGRLALSNRARLQFTTHEGDDRWEVRDKIRAGYEVVDDVMPYLALEVFYLIDPISEYRETRFYVGVDWKATKRIELGAFYLRQQETNVGSPEHNNVLGLEATFRIRRVKNKDKDKDKDEAPAPAAP